MSKTRAVQNRRIVSFDLETELIAPGRSAPKIVCGAFWDGAKMHTYERRRLLPMLAEAIRDPSTVWVNQNIAFDFAALVNARPDLMDDVWRLYREGRVYCTQVAEKLKQIAEGGNGKTSLFDMVFRYFKVRMVGKKEADAWRFRYSELEGLDIEDYPAAARDYVADDVVWALKVAQAQKGAKLPTFHKQVAADWAFYLMGAYGNRVDPWMAKHLKSYVQAKVIEDSDYLKAYGIFRPDGSEDKRKVKTLVVEDYGSYVKDGWRAYNDGSQHFVRDLQARVNKVEELKKAYADLAQGEVDIDLLKMLCSLTTPERIPFTAKGSVQTSKTVLKGSSSKLLQRRAEAGVLKKIWEQYVPLLARGTTYPINPRWNVLVNSGRSSCGNPNLQNLPQLPGVREAFVPHREGYVFIASDYSTAELRSLAEVCYRVLGYSVLGDTIKAGKDPHVVFAADLLGVSYVEAVARVAAGEALATAFRKLAKAFNFGLPGGLGAETFIVFARGMGIIVADYAPAEYWPSKVVDLEADEETKTAVGILYFKEFLKPRWLQTYPEIRDYFNYMGKITQAPWGCSDEEKQAHRVVYEHPVTGFIRGDVQYCSGCNHNFQHLTAAGAKDALVQVAYECYADKSSILYGCRLAAFIHDEIVMEASEAIAHEAALRLERIMKDCMDVYTPNCPSETDAHIMRRWRKKAGRVLQNDRLVPYEDRVLKDEEIEKIKSADSDWRAVVNYGVEPARAAALRC